jgi:Protein of unknown function (DUF2911)
MQCLAPHHISLTALVSPTAGRGATIIRSATSNPAVLQKKRTAPKRRNIAMKKLLVCTGLLFAATAVFAQTPAPKPPPKSPPATATATIGGKAITITYSSPGVKGREGHLFGKDGQIGKDPTYPVWRAGANSATKLEVGGDIHIGDLAVPKGDYTLYVDVSDPDNWVLIVNKQTGQWGTKYDKSMDLGRVKMTMTAPPALVENLTYTLVDNGGGKGSLTLAWENKSGSVAISGE